MARLNLLDARTTNFGELMGNGKIYHVPVFQRNYAWQEENWEDLWRDIVSLNQTPNGSHYLGAIVLQNSPDSDKQFTLIDGQQRLATLSILAIAVIDHIHQLGVNNIEPEANQARREILTRTYLGDRDPRSLRYSSKLFLNENNNDFYQGNLINLRPPLNFRALTKSNQLLWQAFQYYSDRLTQDQDFQCNGEALAAFLTETIAQRLLFIQINVEDEFNAYTVFETLNARGIELSATDLLKNYLFSLCRGPDDLVAAQRQWRQIINTVQMEQFPEFLRCYLSLQQGRVRKQRLFAIVRELVKTPQQTFDLLDQLEQYGALFIALGNPYDEFWRDTPANLPYLQELLLFRTHHSYPTLLAAYQKFPPEDFTRLLKLVCVISFRYTVVSQLNPNALEALYNTTAIAIMTGDITTPRQVFEQLKSVYVRDGKFAQDFSLLSIPTKGQGKKLVRYILAKLETDAARRETGEDSFSIEHILPEASGEHWQPYFTDRQREEMVYRLGNLTPLEPSLNRQLGNADYGLKQLEYQRSVFQLTQGIMAEDWTPQALVSRQQSLAQRAVHIWRSDFE
ncbi:MAG: DUF262 domain-containing protein [Synechocystis sp.]|nr:DUF262 domain-containing protein [Synechocystis sp.]